MMYLAYHVAARLCWIDNCPFGSNVYEINCTQTKYKYDTFQQPQMDENITQLKAELYFFFSKNITRKLRYL